MTFTSWITNATHAAGWSLVQFLWQGSILALALGAALRIARGSSANLRYWLCCIAMAAMALSPVLTWASIELRSIHRTATARAYSVLAGADSAQGAKYLPIEHGADEAIGWADRRITAILVLWFVGALIALARLLASLAAARRLSTTAVAPAPERLQSLADRLAQRWKLRCAVRLAVSDRVTSPVVVGWRRPLVLLPASSLDFLSLEEEESVLAHELAHIRRRDYPVNVIQAALEAVFFYHPAVWWVSRLMRREREHCCDDLVLVVSGSPLVYAKALMHLEEQRLPSQPQLSLGAYGGDLSMRIKRLFDRNRSVSTGRAIAVSLASLGILTVGAVAVLSGAAANRVSAHIAEAGDQHSSMAKITPDNHPRPNLTCTFYTNDNVAHPGLCEGSETDPNVFYCRQTDGEKAREHQIGCKEGVEALRKWEKEQQQSK